MNCPDRVDKRLGFTLLELLVVIAIITILAAMLMPAWCQTRTRSRTVDCQSNQKQIIMAAKMYADENQDNWAPNFPGQSPNWVSGSLDWNPSNPDNTNTAKLVSSAFAVLASYAKNPSIYRCPADDFAVPGEGFRVRSVSMNEAVGTVGTTGGAVNGQWLTGVNLGSAAQNIWRTYGKTSSMVNPTPGFLWVFADEHPDSIGDGSFAVQMAKTGTAATIIDFPGSFHQGAGSFSFADGHAEIHQWMGTLIKPAAIVGGANIGNGSLQSLAGDSTNDIQWLQSHTSAAM